MADLFGATRRHKGRLCRHFLWWFNYSEIKASEYSVDAAIDCGEMHTALKLLQFQLYKYQWHFQVERFVFIPDCRPADLRKSFDLLVGIHEAETFLPHQCFYAGISAIYTSIELLGSIDSADDLRPWLFRQACLTNSPQMVFSPHWRNRECPYKQVISARACLLQLLLAEGSSSVETIEAIGKANLRILNEMPFREVSADVLYRSTTNLLRGLLCLSFNRLGCHQLRNPLIRLRIELENGRYRRPLREAKENHLSLLIEVLELVDLAMTSDSQALRQKRLSIMINTTTPSILNGAREWLDSLDPSPFIG